LIVEHSLLSLVEKKLFNFDKARQLKPCHVTCPHGSRSLRFQRTHNRPLAGLRVSRGENIKKNRKQTFPFRLFAYQKYFFFIRSKKNIFFSRFCCSARLEREYRSNEKKLFSSIVRQNDDIWALLTFHSYCRRLGVCFSAFFIAR
jgi:hypothetical protein